VLAGTLIGGYAATRLVRVINQVWVRRFVIGVAAGMTAYFFIAN